MKRRNDGRSSRADASQTPCSRFQTRCLDCHCAIDPRVGKKNDGRCRICQRRRGGVVK